MHRHLTVLLWLVLACAVVPTAAMAALWSLAMLMFAREFAHASLAKILLATTAPLFLALGMVAAAAFILWLWTRPRGRFAAFPLALGLVGLAAFAMAKGHLH